MPNNKDEDKIPEVVIPAINKLMLDINNIAKYEAGLKIKSRSIGGNKSSVCWYCGNCN